MMKRLLLCLLFSAAATAWAQVKLEEVVKPGTKLIYSVTSDLGSYDFIITLKDVKGTSFSWEMTSPANMKGEITHTPKALQGGYKMYNYFQSESKKLDDQSLAIWLSQKMFNDLIKGKDAVKVCMYNPHDEPELMKNFMEGNLIIKVDGNGTMIKDKVVKPAKKVKDKWIIDPTIDDQFTFYNSASFPIVTRMHTNFLSLALKEVRTAEPPK